MLPYAALTVLGFITRSQVPMYLGRYSQGLMISNLIGLGILALFAYALFTQRWRLLLPLSLVLAYAFTYAAGGNSYVSGLGITPWLVYGTRLSTTAVMLLLAGVMYPGCSQRPRGATRAANGSVPRSPANIRGHYGGGTSL
jgi:hypothetical protein